MIRILIIFSLFLLTASCSFNKMFLQPDPAPVGNSVLIPNKGDTIRVNFTGGNHQPEFLKNDGSIVSLSYSIESVLFKSSSGNLLNGWMIRPLSGENDITILHFHGNAGYLLSQYQFMIPFVKKGYRVFNVDYSGFGYSEGKAKRQHVLKDGLSALEYLKNRPDQQNRKLIIYGQSLGGNLAAAVAAKKQEDVDAVIIEGAFSSHQDIGATVAGFLARIFIREMYSAKKAIKKFHKSVLIIHSTEDETIPFRQGQRIYENANDPKSFYEIKGPHIYAPMLYADSVEIKIKTLLK